MKLLCASIFLACAFAAFAQTEQSTKTPVELIYNRAGEVAKWPVHSGVLNFKTQLEVLPGYPAKAKEKGIEGRVEVQILVNEDGQVIFANPLSGPEELWAEAVKAAVSARYPPFSVEGKPRKVHGRIIFDFKDGKVELPFRRTGV